MKKKQRERDGRTVKKKIMADDNEAVFFRACASVFIFILFTQFASPFFPGADKCDLLLYMCYIVIRRVTASNESYRVLSFNGAAINLVGRVVGGERCSTILIIFNYLHWQVIANLRAFNISGASAYSPYLSCT